MENKFGQLLFIPGENGARYPNCNSLYIDDELSAIIDPASGETALKKISGERNVDVIVNTHYHEDHIGLNYLFPEADLYVHQEDAPCLKSLDTFMDYEDITGTEFEEMWRKILVSEFHYVERTPARELQDGDVIDFGKMKMEVVHTPGHTIGHSSFYFPDEGVLFMGDLDLSSFGPYYGSRVADIDQTKESVRRLMQVPARVYITSHERGIVHGDITELAEAYISIIDEREQDLVEYLSEPRTFDEIIDQWIIYKKPRKPLEFYLFGERAMIKKHLEQLMKRGRVVLQGERYSLV